MSNKLEGLEKKHFVFIEKECGYSKEDLLKLSDDELYDSVYDVMCDIECRETPTGSSELSERCSLAAFIVTTIGNNFAQEDDEWHDDEDDFFNEDEEDGDTVESVDPTKSAMAQQSKYKPGMFNITPPSEELLEKLRKNAEE